MRRTVRKTARNERWLCLLGKYGPIMKHSQQYYSVVTWAWWRLNHQWLSFDYTGFRRTSQKTSKSAVLALCDVIRQRMCLQCNDVTWAPWCLKSPACPVFVQEFVRANIKQTSNLHMNGLCGGNPLVTGGFKRPETQKAFPLQNVIMEWKIGDHTALAVEIIDAYY